MANTTIQLKKSGTTSNVPAALSHGEIAINYADGKLYYKNTTNHIVSFSSTPTYGTINANNTLLIADYVGSILTVVPGDNIFIVGDAVNDKITITANIAPAFDKANAASTEAVAAYGQANTARTHANAAFTSSNNAQTQATTARTHANAAFLEANTASIEAGAAFDKANNANLFVFGVSANTNLAWVQANTARTHANAAFAVANTAATDAVNSFDKANVALSNTTGSVFDGTLYTSGNFTVNTTSLTGGYSFQSNGNGFITNSLRVGTSNAVTGGTLGIGTNAAAGSKLRTDTLANTDAGLQSIYSTMYIDDTVLTAGRVYTVNLGSITNRSLHQNIDGSTLNSQLFGNYTILYNAPITGGEAFSWRTVGHNIDIRNYATGTNSYMSFAKGSEIAISSASPARINVAYGIDSYIYPTNTTSTGTIGTAYGYSSTIGRFNSNTVIDIGYHLYGIYPISSNVTTRWGIYITGEDKNYFSGNVGIKTTTPTSALHVVGNANVTGAIIVNNSDVMLSIDAANSFTIKAFGQANSAYTSSNTAQVQATTARTHANSAFAAANTASTKAGDAFDKANNANLFVFGVSANANLAWVQANTARTHANAAFLEANTASAEAVASFGQANTARTHANAAFARANTTPSYETGTFTTTCRVADLATGGNVSVTTPSYAAYTKIGNMCTVFIAFTNIQTQGLVAGNQMYVRGLPFTSYNGNFQTAPVSATSLTYGTDIPVFQITGNSTYGRVLRERSGAAFVASSISDYANNTSGLYVTATYITA